MAVDQRAQNFESTQIYETIPLSISILFSRDIVLGNCQNLEMQNFVAINLSTLRPNVICGFDGWTDMAGCKT